MVIALLKPVVCVLTMPREGKATCASDTLALLPALEEVGMLAFPGKRVGCDVVFAHTTKASPERRVMQRSIRSAVCIGRHSNKTCIYNASLVFSLV